MFEREDWELFRTVEGLCSRAGVSRDKIASLVAKELADNALDTGTPCNVGLLDDGAGFFVSDEGPGLDLAQVADLFSIKRPMKSTKLFRLPTRGALGNGLRVVASAVLATGGSLKVYTRGRALNVIPCADGSTTVEAIGAYDCKGTRVEVRLGHDVGPINGSTLNWSHNALMLADGEKYRGKTSPWWYTPSDFRELCLAAKDMTIRDLVSEFEGCKNGNITAGFKGKKASDVTLGEAEVLLKKMRNASKPVAPKRLGYCNSEHLENRAGYYARVEGTYTLKSNSETIEIPYVIEAWIKFQDRASIMVHVNRTPITGEVAAAHNKTQLCLSGCNLSDELHVYPIEVGRKPVRAVLNIITPCMPITSTGKSPDLSHLKSGITEAIEKAVRKAKRNPPIKGYVRSQKDVVIEHLDECIDQASGGRKHRYSLRQLYYAIRPFVHDELGRELSYENFSNKIITDYENELGHDLPGLYRDNRGVLYHPHRHEDIPLGTRVVEGYERPKWTFNKILYCEKEGFFEILKDEEWPERHDCALLTSKGFASRAARDLLDMLGDTDEEITFFCIHDADAAGTLIYESLQEATKARPKRRVNVINLGLDPSEASEMGLEVEELENNKSKRPVANYVESEWAEWLQYNRVELNAMSTPQFLDWLDGKMSSYGNGKLIPPYPILANELHGDVKSALRDRITEDILRAQNVDGKTQQAYSKIKPKLDEIETSLAKFVSEELNEEPSQSWRDPIMKTAQDLIR